MGGLISLVEFCMTTLMVSWLMARPDEEDEECSRRLLSYDGLPFVVAWRRSEWRLLCLRSARTGEILKDRVPRFMWLGKNDSEEVVIDDVWSWKGECENRALIRGVRTGVTGFRSADESSELYHSPLE